MKKALFVPWSFTLLETYLPVADLLIQKGFEVSFLNQLDDKNRAAGHAGKMVNKRLLDYYKKYCGFTSEVEELKNLDNIVWIDVKDIGEILYKDAAIREISFSNGEEIIVDDYDLIVMRTEYPKAWPAVKKWMKQTKVAGMPIRMMSTEINKKRCETGYIFYDHCYKAKMIFSPQKDLVLYCYSSARNLYDPRDDSEMTAINNQKEFLKNFIRIIVAENGKTLIIRGHPQYHKYESNKYVDKIVDDICLELSLDRSRIIVRNDEFIGKELAQAEIAIFDPGASALMKGIMFDCNMLSIDFPCRYYPRANNWYRKLYKKYLSDLFVNNFDELALRLKKRNFPIIVDNQHIDYFTRYFDGKCTARSVDFIFQNIAETHFRLFVSSKIQKISDRIFKRRDLGRQKI